MLKEVNQITNDRVEQALSLAKDDLKDVPHAIEQARETRKQKDFDASYIWNMLILECSKRASSSLSSLYDYLLSVKGNTSDLIHRFRRVEDVDIGHSNFYFNIEHDHLMK